MQQTGPDALPWTRFSQHEDLTVRLRNILHDYAFGPGIFREFLQNADDARATRLVLLADGVTYPGQELLDERLAAWQGPALCAFNDAVFSDADFEGICRVGASAKRGDETKIGHYGLGFNSCYHLSDVISFTSRDRLCIFDPHERHLPGDIPGLQLRLGWEEIELFGGQLRPFQEVAQACGVECWPLEGAIFRLPLRTPALAESSQICPESHGFREAVQVLEELLRGAQDLLLFLQSVERLEVMVRHPAGGKAHWQLLGSASLRTACLETGAKLRRERRLADLEGSVKARRGGMAFVVDVRTELEGEGHRASSFAWLLARRCEGLSADEKERQAELPKHRHSAVALRLWPFEPEEELHGQAFCFLPLSLSTGLPVHISANFAISANRRDLWRRSDDKAASFGNLRAAWNEVLLDQTLPRVYADALEMLTTAFPSQTSKKQQPELDDVPFGAADFLDAEIRQQVQAALLSRGEHLWRFWPGAPGASGSFEALPGKVAQELLSRQAAVFWSAGLGAFCSPRSSLLCPAADYAGLEEALRSALAKLQLAGCRRSLVEVPAPACATLAEKGATWLQPQSLATALRAAPPQLSTEEADAVVAYLLAPGGQGPLTVLHGLHIFPLLPAPGAAEGEPALGCFSKPDDLAAQAIWWADDPELKELVPDEDFADPSSRTFKLLRPRLHQAPLKVQMLNAKSLPDLLPGLFPPAWRGKGEVSLADSGAILVDGCPAASVQVQWTKAAAVQAKAAAKNVRQAKVPAPPKTGKTRDGRRQWGADDYGDWDDEQWQEWDDDYEDAARPAPKPKAARAKGAATPVVEEAGPLPRSIVELERLVRRCKLLWQLAERCHEKGAAPVQLLSDLPCIPIAGRGDSLGNPVLLSVRAAERRKVLALQDFTQQERAVLEGCGCIFTDPVKHLRKALRMEKASMAAALASALRFRSASGDSRTAVEEEHSRLFMGLKQRRIPVQEALPLRSLIKSLLQRRLIPNDATALEALPIFETLGGEVAVPLSPPAARIMAPTEEWDELLRPQFADYLPSWQGEAGELLKDLGRERGPLAAFLADFCGPRLGQLSQAVCVHFLEATASLGNVLWKSQVAPKDHTKVAQFCHEAPLVVFLGEGGSVERRCRIRDLADPVDSAMCEVLGQAAAFPPEAYCTPVILSVMRKAGLRSMSDPDVFLQVAQAVESSPAVARASGVLLRYLVSCSEATKWPSRTFSALARLRIFPALRFDVMREPLPPSDQTAAAADSQYIGLDSPCTLQRSAEVAWTQLPILHPRSFDAWPPALVQCFGGIKVSPPLQTVLENLVAAASRWADGSSGDLLIRRQQVVAKHLEVLAVYVKRSHINQVTAQTILTMIAFVVLDDGSLAKPCDIFTALHDDGSSDEEEPSSHPRSGAKKKGSRCRSAWSLPKYLRPFRRFLLAMAGPMVDSKKSIPMIRVGLPPDAALIPDFMKGALNKPELADLEFALSPSDGGPPKLVYAHRLMLAAACDYFRVAMASGFSSKLGPEGRCRIDLPDWVDLRPLLWLLAYLYHSYDPEKAWTVARQLDVDGTQAAAPSGAARSKRGRLPRVSDDEMGDDLCCLMRLAEFYDLKHLKQWCEKRLQGLLSEENVIAISTHAFFCNASQLLPLCIYHMQVMYADLVRTGAWEDLDEGIKELVLQQVNVAT